MTPPAEAASLPAHAARIERVAWASLIAWLWISRWVVAPAELIEWDSANYALALREYDIFDHQPHAPGYPGLVLLLRLFSFLPGDTTPFVAVNSVLGAALLLTLGWGLRPIVGRAGGWLAAAAFSVCAPFWFQGAASTAYVAECFCSVAIGVSALAVARGTLRPAVAAVFAGAVLGIRPSGAIALLPVLTLGWAYHAAKRWKAGTELRAVLREAAVAVAAFAVVCAAWFFPMIALGGGWSAYRDASAMLGDWQMRAGSALGGDLSKAASNARRLGWYLFDCMNVLWISLALNSLVAALRWRLRIPALAWLLTWFIPGTAVYVLHHLAKSAYVLTLAPILFAAVALAYAAAIDGAGPRLRRAMQGLNLVVAVVYGTWNVVAFAFAAPNELLKYRDADIPVADVLPVSGDYGRLSLRYRTYAQRHMNAVLRDLDDSVDLAIFTFGTHELHRFATFYHPTQWMVATSIDHGTAFETPVPRNRPSIFPRSFGEFQRIILHRPRAGLTWKSPTRVDLQPSALVLSREGRRLELPLRQTPDRIVVFAQCPPCDATAGAGFAKTTPVHIGAGYAAFDFHAAPKTISP